jgi:hypothetical protein
LTKPATHPDRPNITSFPLMPAFNTAFFDNFTRTGETCGKACPAWQEELFPGADDPVRRRCADGV